MPNGRDDGCFASIDGVDHRLRIKRPQILHRPAATTNDQYIQPHFVQLFNRPGNAFRRAVALHHSGGDHQFRRRKAPSGNLLNIRHCRTVSRGGYANPQGVLGYRLLVTVIKQPSSRQTGL